MTLYGIANANECKWGIRASGMILNGYRSTLSTEVGDDFGRVIEAIGSAPLHGTL